MKLSIFMAKILKEILAKNFLTLDGISTAQTTRDLCGLNMHSMPAPRHCNPTRRNVPHPSKYSVTHVTVAVPPPATAPNRHEPTRCPPDGLKTVRDEPRATQDNCSPAHEMTNQKLICKYKTSHKSDPSGPTNLSELREDPTYAQ